MRSFKFNLNVLNVFLAIALVLTVAVRLSTIDAEAYAGKKGYAVFRNGVGGNLNDHAAMMDKSSKGMRRPIIHAVGFGGQVQWGSWAAFIGDGEYLCTSKPKNCTMTEQRQELFVAKTRELRGIDYTFINQIAYSAGGNMYVCPENITNLRCDGVVEYVYEWFLYRVGGGDNKWDISENKSENYDEHRWFYITPRKQWMELLNLVSMVEPL